METKTAMMLDTPKGKKLAMLVRTRCKQCGRERARWLYKTALKDLAKIGEGLYEVPDCMNCITWE